MSNKEFINYISEQFRQGLSRAQVAKKLGMTIEAFEDKCKKIYGVETKKPVEKKKAIKIEEKIEAFKNAGYSNETIAKELNIPEAKVERKYEE